ncbi:hypothetical protein AOLI_G00106450 [Acnodon oligacanthus]
MHEPRCEGCRWDRKGAPSTFTHKPGIHRRARWANRGFGTRLTFSPMCKDYSSTSSLDLHALISHRAF